MRQRARPFDWLRTSFSLHAGVRCAAHDRQDLEQLCRYITRPTISNDGQFFYPSRRMLVSVANRIAHQPSPRPMRFATLTGILRPGAKATLAPDAVSRRAGAQCEAEGEGGAEKHTDKRAHRRACNVR